MIPLIKEDINRKYSPTWVYCNDNSRAKIFREKFIKNFGGEFTKDGRNYFKWQEIKPPVIKRRKFIFEDINGIIYTIENVYDFCKVNNLKRSAIYELVSGKRKTHKGFKFICEIPQNI